MSGKLLYTVSYQADCMDCGSGGEDLLFSTTNDPLKACQTFIDCIIKKNNLNSDADPVEPSDHYALIIRPCEFTASSDPFDDEWKFTRFRSNNLLSKKNFLKYCQHEFKEKNNMEEMISTLSQHCEEIELKKQQNEKKRKLEKANNIDRQVAKLLTEKNSLGSIIV